VRGASRLEGPVFVGANDVFFALQMNAGNPQLVFAPADYQDYDRINDRHRWYIGGTEMFRVTSANAAFWEGGALSDTYNLRFVGGRAVFGYDGGVGAAIVSAAGSKTIRLYVDAGTEVARFHYTPNEGMATQGWLRAGALTAPTNTTDGDLTVARLIVGDAALTAGVELQLTGDMTASGYARFGSVAAPAATGAGQVTVEGLFVVDGGNFSLSKPTGTTSRSTWDSGDTYDFNQSNNYWDWNVASILVARLGGSSTQPYFELQIDNGAPANATANMLRGYARDHTHADVMWWRDNAGKESSGTMRARTLTPKAVSGMIGGAATAVLPTTTSSFVGLVTLECAISVKTLSYSVSADAVGAGQVVRLAVYDESGQNKLIDVTDAVGTNTGVRDVTVSPSVVLPAGNYYFFICSSVNAATTNSTVKLQSTESTFITGAASEPDLEGALTISGGTAPATFDPTAITTPTGSRTPFFRVVGDNL